MKSNIILSGVGGQGILTLASIIDTAALYQNLFVKFETEEKQKTIHTLQKEQALSEELIDEHRKNNQILVASLTLLTFMLSVVVYFFISNQKKIIHLLKLIKI